MNRYVELSSAQARPFRPYKLSPQVIEGLVYAVPLSTALWAVVILALATIL